jgi:hypothetical protein
MRVIITEKQEMSTTALKKMLIQRISEINDKSFLEAIRKILDTKADAKTFYLTPEIIEQIKESKKEIENGLSIENDSLERESEEWLTAQ